MSFSCESSPSSDEKSSLSILDISSEKSRLLYYCMISFSSILDSESSELNEESSLYFYYFIAFICQRRAFILPNTQQDYISYEMPVGFIIITLSIFTYGNQQQNQTALCYSFQLNSIEDNRMELQKSNHSPNKLNQTTGLSMDLAVGPVNQVLSHGSTQVNFSLHSGCSSSEKCLSCSLRILNPYQQHSQPKKISILERTYLGNKKQLGFGSTQVRQVKIFQKPRVLQQSRQENDLSHALITHSFFKQESFTQSGQTQQNTSKLAQKSPEESTLSHIRSKIGFGVGMSLKRTELNSLFRPGPGSYQISKSFQSLKDKRLQTSFSKGSCDKLTKQNLLRQSEKLSNQPGDFSDTNEFKDIYKLKQKRRQILNEKKQKMRNLICKMKQNIPRLEQQLKPRDLSLKQVQNRKFEKYSKNCQIKKKHKILRTELKQKTDSFLPVVEEVRFDQNLRHEYRGPLYKFMFSNSFVKKNDHAFEAHSYKERQKESQYILLKGRAQYKPQENQNSFFKSKLGRKLY